MVSPIAEECITMMVEERAKELYQLEVTYLKRKIEQKELLF